ncbi:MAG: type II toxin-antitoxin system VapC family toxin [Tepidisphaerales bacterium]
MQAVLLDTDVFSFFFKRDSRASLYAPHLQNARPCLSFQTVAELRCWAIIKHWGDARRRSLDEAMRMYIIFPYDDALSRCWADITAYRRSTGRPIECGDAWIAATATLHGIPIITNNAKDYEGIPGLSVISHQNDPPS